MITSLNEFKKYITESLKSDILRQIISKEKYIKQNFHDLDLANITDEDFIELTGKEARKKQYEDYYLFWFSGENFKAFSRGKYVNFVPQSEVRYKYGRTRRRGREITPSTLELANLEDSKVYALSPEGAKRQNRYDIRSNRSKNREGALALMNPEWVKDKNLERYRSIIASKGNKLNEFDGIVKYFMDKYSNELGNIKLSEDPKIKQAGYSREEGSPHVMKEQIATIGKKLTKLLDAYQRYASIIDYAEKGHMYKHQESDRKNIEKAFTFWKAKDEVTL